MGYSDLQTRKSPSSYQFCPFPAASLLTTCKLFRNAALPILTYKFYRPLFFLSLPLKVELVSPSDVHIKRSLWAAVWPCGFYPRCYSPQARTWLSFTDLLLESMFFRCVLTRILFDYIHLVFAGTLFGDSCGFAYLLFPFYFGSTVFLPFRTNSLPWLVFWIHLV